MVEDQGIWMIKGRWKRNTNVGGGSGGGSSTGKLC